MKAKIKKVISNCDPSHQGKILTEDGNWKYPISYSENTDGDAETHVPSENSLVLTLGKYYIASSYPLSEMLCN